MTSYRRWKKEHKKKYLIGEDSFGNKLYVGDEVELEMTWEVSSKWRSKIYFNMMDGAFIDAHPAHISMKLSVHRDLREIITNGSCLKTKNFYIQ
jgi:hypothetical protein